MGRAGFDAYAAKDPSKANKLHGFVRMFAMGGNAEVNPGFANLVKRWEQTSVAAHNALGMPTDFSITETANLPLMTLPPTRTTP